MVLRPDELSSQYEIERDASKRSMVKKGIKSAAGLAAGAAGLGSAGSSKVLPFLNSYVPMDLALKGIEKVAPEVGKFLRRGQEAGMDMKQGLDFVRSKFEGDEGVERNIIEQYSPELHKFILEKINAGSDPSKVEIEAKHKYKDVINNIEKDHKATWYDIFKGIYGVGGQAPAKQQQQQAPQMQQQSQIGIDPNLQAIGQKLQQLLQSKGM